ncbi:MAG TPA: putative DNA binding domain-containing protein, partial [Methanocorpusculum sp.]|nr:putative DNA binding domain-containing protein [Methanocorpusculum sp.]
MMIGRLIAEVSDYEYKVALERNKPRSWLKSVSAFANTAGGTLFFGVDNDHNVVGLSDPQRDSEDISRLIKERISPTPRFILTAEQEYGKAVLILSIPKGTHTPYYYKADGIREAYIRLGDESIVAPNHILHELILDGMNESFDALVSKYDAKDFAFSKLRERYKKWTGKSFDDKYLVSFGLVDEDTNKLTNAGVLIADDSPLRQSRVFCVRWNGLTKAGGLVDAFDSSEFTGSIIKLLEDGMSFIKRNTKMMWRKAPTSRIEMPEYADRSCLEALVNALVHRSYLELGSEVHIDIFDD